MSLIFRRQDFGPNCPSGGIWYSCGFGSKFVGCCDSAPCDHGCPAGNLKPASFIPASHGHFSDQQCSAGLWYTCNTTAPPFMGCCKSNPCMQNGCPQVNLTAGFLSSNPSDAAEFNPSGGSSAATSSPTATSRLSSSTTDSTSRPDVTSSPPKPSHTGAIAGGAIGGVAAIALLIALLLLHYKKKSSKSRQNMIDSRVAPEKPVPMYPESNTSAHDPKHSPFPGKFAKLPACINSLTTVILQKNNSPRQLLCTLLLHLYHHTRIRLLKWTHNHTSNPNNPHLRIFTRLIPPLATICQMRSV